MKPFLLLFTSFLFLVLHVFGQDLLKKWDYTSYHILKSGQSTTISGHIRTSKDSCQMNFIDLGTTRNLTGILGHDVVLNLCKNTIELKPIEKPNWLSTPIDSAIIKDLQSDSVQRVHPKMNEALRIFTTHEYTVLNNKYIASEWQAPFLPRYQITLFQGKTRYEVLLYYDRYIIDNFIYSTGSNQGTSPEDLHFWESNLKLLLRDQLIDKNSTVQH